MKQTMREKVARWSRVAGFPVLVVGGCLLMIGCDTIPSGMSGQPRQTYQIAPGLDVSQMRPVTNQTAPHGASDTALSIERNCGVGTR